MATLYLQKDNYEHWTVYETKYINFTRYILKNTLQGSKSEQKHMLSLRKTKLNWKIVQ